METLLLRQLVASSVSTWLNLKEIDIIAGHVLQYFFHKFLSVISIMLPGLYTKYSIINVRLCFVLNISFSLELEMKIFNNHKRSLEKLANIQFTLSFMLSMKREGWQHFHDGITSAPVRNVFYPVSIWREPTV